MSVGIVPILVFALYAGLLVLFFGAYVVACLIFRRRG